MENSILREYQRLIEEIRTCTRCSLHRTRTNPVPGEGPLDSELMFVGEAPGRNEDLEGRPFVGQAGKILTAMLNRIGLSRSQVYITNVVKCRPPGNRDPKPEEIRACLPYLIRQIKLIKPRIIVTLGRHAGKTLYELAGLHWPGMSRAHGVARNAVIDGLQVILFSTYHPAAALYKPDIRKVLESDFDKLRDLLGEDRRKNRSLLDYF